MATHFPKQELIFQLDYLCYCSLRICVDRISQQRNIAQHCVAQTETLFLPFLEGGGANEPVLASAIYLGQVNGVKHQIGSPGV